MADSKWGPKWDRKHSKINIGKTETMTKPHIVMHLFFLFKINLSKQVAGCQYLKPKFHLGIQGNRQGPN